MAKRLLRIFDFDNTIYDGNVTLDFFKYVLKRHFLRIVFLPVIGVYFIMLRNQVIELVKFVEVTYKFLVRKDTVRKDLEKFWESHYCRIKPLYFNRRRGTIIVITASPYPFIEPIVYKLGCRLIASEFDLDTGKFTGPLCYGIEKAIRLTKEGINNCDEFYTDEYSDSPLIKMANYAYLVTGNSVQLIWKR
jgi:hypothetical protein